MGGSVIPKMTCKLFSRCRFACAKSQWPDSLSFPYFPDSLSNEPILSQGLRCPQVQPAEGGKLTGSRGAGWKKQFSFSFILPGTVQHFLVFPFLCSGHTPWTIDITIHTFTDKETKAQRNQTAHSHAARFIWCWALYFPLWLLKSYIWLLGTLDFLVALGDGSSEDSPQPPFRLCVTLNFQILVLGLLPEKILSKVPFSLGTTWPVTQ